jgi:hypothetical protein
MPYTITTTLPLADGRPHAVANRAVATLDEARSAIQTDLCDWHDATGPDDPNIVATLDLSESGGTIGPLSDGSTIEVKHVRWDDLRDELRTLGVALSYDHGHAAEAILEAFNAHN